MVRTEFVMSRYHASNLHAPVTNFFEQRALYFASAEGHAEFLHKLTSSKTKPTVAWRTLFDGEIKGPWSKWTTVWRHVVELPSYDFLDRRCVCFFW